VHIVDVEKKAVTLMSYKMNLLFNWNNIKYTKYLDCLIK